MSEFFSVALRLHRRRQKLDFILMENVSELSEVDGGNLLDRQIKRLERNDFRVNVFLLQAADHGVPQYRKRLFLLALRNGTHALENWILPKGSNDRVNVRKALKGLPEPIRFDRALTADDIPHHPNHWCMNPKSPRFFNKSLVSGYRSGRSFKTLAWDAPSISVSYGHREVHVHPDGYRRLSVFEAMLLQGFPKSYVLEGTLSAQIDQVSEAVPPPLARAIANSIGHLTSEELPCMDNQDCDKSSAEAA